LHAGLQLTGAARIRQFRHPITYNPPGAVA